MKKTDKERYWELFEAFVTAVAVHARENYGARYFHAPGNEPSLASCTDHPVYEDEYPGWQFWYMDPAIHLYDAVKRANPDNQVVIGALVTGSKGHVGALYQAGAKGHFDVIDIHAYDQSGKTHVSMEQIMTVHEVLAEYGDADKKIWLGEGWSCFPLPKSLDGNLDKSRRFTKEEVEHYWKTIQVGWMNLTTPRPGEYNPKWVLGARYFTFCDLIEGRGWRKRAVPQVDENGNVTHYLVDGYPKQKDELGPFYRPWGIVDIEGEPKGDFLERIPPYIPKYRHSAILRGVKHGGTVQADTPYEAVVRMANLEKKPMLDVRLGIYGRGKQGEKIKITTLENDSADTLSPRRGMSSRFELVYPKELRGNEVRFYGECNYTWEGLPYYADAWGPVVRVE